VAESNAVQSGDNLFWLGGLGGTIPRGLSSIRWAAYDNGLTDESGYAAAAKDVRVEINRWPHFRAGVDQWLSNYPENSHQPIFQPVVTPEA
jgi:hypothetical protein